MVDVWNIETYGQYWNQKRMPDNIKLNLYVKKGKKYVYDIFGRPSSTIIPSIGGNIIDAQYDAEQSDNENNCGFRSIVALYMFNNLEPDLVAKYL